MPTIYLLSLLQLTVFVTCILFSATAAYVSVFKEIWILSNLGRLKNTLFFDAGGCFALFSQVKEAKETFSLAKVQSGIAYLFELQVQILQIAVRRREGGKKSF